MKKLLLVVRPSSVHLRRGHADTVISCVFGEKSK